jgi:hypothetical protein
MLARYVLNELILAIVFNCATFACVGLIVSVPPLVILAVSNRGEALGTEPTVIRFLACVSPHMHEKVAFFSKYLSTIRYSALEKIMSGVC